MSRDLGLVSLVDTTEETENEGQIPTPAGLKEMNLYVTFSVEEETDLWTAKAKDSSGTSRAVTMLP